MQWRQGDVLIETVDQFSEDLSKSEDRLLVRGEGRYHGHFIEGEVSIYPNPEFGMADTISHFLEIEEEAELRHLHTETKDLTGEHQTLRLKPGKYRVIRQREYNPYARIIQIIRD